MRRRKEGVRSYRDLCFQATQTYWRPFPYSWNVWGTRQKKQPWWTAHNAKIEPIMVPSLLTWRCCFSKISLCVTTAKEVWLLSNDTGCVDSQNNTGSIFWYSTLHKQNTKGYLFLWNTSFLGLYGYSVEVLLVVTTEIWPLCFVHFYFH